MNPSEPILIPASAVQRFRSLEFSVDASDIGLEPGKFPERAKIEGQGGTFIRARPVFLKDELAMVIYKNDTNITELFVLNS